MQLSPAPQFERTRPRCCARAFGFTDRQKFFSYLAGIVVLAVVFYYTARAVRSREGVDVSLAYSEIPPE